MISLNELLEDKINEKFSRTLIKHGWATVRSTKINNIKNDLLKLAMLLGEPKPLRKSGDIVQSLSPVSSTEANPMSLSRMHSMGIFPLHVDTAHWSIPCRFVILACSVVGAGNRKTKLLDSHRLNLSNQERELFLNSPFRIRNGHQSFFGTVFSLDREFIRYDPGCMFPTSEDGKMIQCLMSEERWAKDIFEFEWQPGGILILDNWRMLHGRGQSVCDDSDRTLYRLLVT